MNLLHLKYAVEVAKTRSISKAAENLFMGQPNLSRAIKELESDLGITIFKRTTKGISVTSEGEEFLERARRIVLQVDEIERMYKNGGQEEQRLSVCAPRASYISHAMAEFASGLRTDIPAEIFYKETNSSKAMECVSNGEYNLGIIRYQQKFGRYFDSVFQEKRLTAETMTEFTYVLLMSKNSELSQLAEIRLSDLRDKIEITHSDPYVPSIPMVDVRRSELMETVDKRIFVFERGSQFELLEKVPMSFMWVSPVSPELCKKYGLVQRFCRENTKRYKDVLIYRNDYRLSSLDNRFLDEVRKSADRYLVNK